MKHVYISEKNNRDFSRMFYKMRFHVIFQSVLASLLTLKRVAQKTGLINSFDSFFLPRIAPYH